MKTAAEYWANRSVKSFYLCDGPQREVAVKLIAELKGVRRILEFGCNVGMNLYKLKIGTKRYSRLVGYDINQKAVEVGKKQYGLDLRVGGEDDVEGKYDLIFTVSVIDHVPNAKEVLTKLAAHTKRMLLVEPYNGTTCLASDVGSSAPYSYIWDYVSLFKELGFKCRYVRETPIGKRAVQKIYHAFLVEV